MRIEDATYTYIHTYKAVSLELPFHKILQIFLNHILVTPHGGGLTDVCSHQAQLNTHQQRYPQIWHGLFFSFFFSCERFDSCPDKLTLACIVLRPLARLTALPVGLCLHHKKVHEQRYTSRFKSCSRKSYFVQKNYASVFINATCSCSRCINKHLQMCFLSLHRRILRYEHTVPPP